MGSDPRRNQWPHCRTHFNPRSPCGERQLKIDNLPDVDEFQSTLPMWGATLKQSLIKMLPLISIHAPHVGSDPLQSLCIYIISGISIHAPHVGSDFGFIGFDGGIAYFNPRSPCGERRDVHAGDVGGWVISIHAPHVGSDSAGVFLSAFVAISIHAPHVGSDITPNDKCQSQKVFQSTLPMWGATPERHWVWMLDNISIHAPHVGSDSALPLRPAIDDISIHAPHVGSDTRAARDMAVTTTFQSTLPMWGATRRTRKRQAGADVFQSTLPMWGATMVDKNSLVQLKFQSTLPMWGATCALL